MDFFITGLPRSKTAWFAAYFSNDNYRCYHERVATHGLGTILQQKSDPQIITGVSDSALLAYWEDLELVFPNAKWLVVNRDFEECKRSCLVFGLREHNIMFAKK